MYICPLNSSILIKYILLCLLIRKLKGILNKMAILKNILQSIGNTPLSKLNKINKNIFAKLEYFNPGGSIKDRIAYSMIADAENKALIKPNISTIIEPTSGNTGIGLALVCAVRGYKLILTMPESMSLERRKILKALGANIILTSSGKGMQGSIDKAKELKNSLKNSYIPQQFKNPANPAIHEKTTAVEIWDALEGNIDILVAGVGTGGTITGCARCLKRKKEVIIVAVEPYGSPVLSGGKPGSHKIQGIGAGFIPEVLNLALIDEIVKVKNEDAVNESRELGMKEGIFVGISSGAALWAAKEISKKRPNKNIVVIFPDGAERYLSTDLFNNNSATK